VVAGVVVDVDGINRDSAPFELVEERFLVVGATVGDDDDERPSPGPGYQATAGDLEGVREWRRSGCALRGECVGVAVGRAAEGEFQVRAVPEEGEDGDVDADVVERGNELCGRRLGVPDAVAVH